MLRKTAASMVASVALLSPGAVQAQPAPEQVEQAVADSAAQTYRTTRADILRRYHAATSDAQAALARATDRQQAWQEYKEATAEAAHRAKQELQDARETFRRTVQLARG